MSFLDSVHALVRDTTAVWGFVTAVGFVLLLTPLVARLAPLVGGVDDKHDRPRVHGGRPLVGNFHLGWAAYPLTVFWIAALANLVNLIDGMDSLASGIVAIAAGSFAILAASFARADAAALAAIICGASLAFLRYNFHP